MSIAANRAALNKGFKQPRSDTRDTTIWLRPGGALHGKHYGGQSLDCPKVSKGNGPQKSRPFVFAYASRAGSTSRTMNQNASGPSAIRPAASTNGGV